MQQITKMSCQGCNLKFATFGFKGHKAIRCLQCKEAGMVNVKVRPCRHEGCTKQPSFGLPNGERTFCKTHKEAGMVNLKNIICAYSGCRLTPCFVDSTDLKRYCALHSLRQMTCTKKPLAIKQFYRYF